MPVMAEKLDVEGFVKELCGGFQLLCDSEKGLITAESLRANSELVGMEAMTEQDAEAMAREGDLNGGGNGCRSASSSSLFGVFFT
ncbi:unnamed protein product [Linum tenue]|uniref:EF-hand domain-containing protein n=1 Tax=Linum tenue TaxID=586396 RepID=A0AAV0N2E7_9ROSI|nr:unnamed protein product [Linum tenue]